MTVKEQKVRGEQVKELVGGEVSEKVEKGMRDEGIKEGEVRTEEVEGEALKDAKGK